MVEMVPALRRERKVGRTASQNVFEIDRWEDTVSAEVSNVCRQDGHVFVHDLG